MSGIGLWPTLSFRDADAMIAWLEAIGFTGKTVYRDENDPTHVQHAEIRWPGGGIMFGSHREGNDVTTATGRGAAYLVTDDPDGVFEAAVRAGGTVVRPMVDQDYGGRGGSVADPEGNVWSFGDYRPD